MELGSGPMSSGLDSTRADLCWSDWSDLNEVDEKKIYEIFIGCSSRSLLILGQITGEGQEVAATVTYLGRAVDISRASLGVFWGCFWSFICDPFEEWELLLPLTSTSSCVGLFVGRLFFANLVISKWSQSQTEAFCQVFPRLLGQQHQ